MVKLTVHMDDELRKRFKVACAEDSEDMSAVVRRLIQQWLDEREKRSRK